jgi:hypothetical protein
LAGFTSHRFANVKPRERLLFENDWLDSFSEKEHCRRSTRRSTADYKNIGFDHHEGADDNKRNPTKQRNFSLFCVGKSFSFPNGKYRAS